MTKTNFAPPPNYLIAAAAQNLGWARALAELIDNAIDKKATRIDILEGPTEDRRPRHFEIRDNGEGCPNPAVITTYGSRGDQNDDNGLGRYGVGGPEAIMDIGGLDATVIIESVFEGVIRGVTLPWRRLLRTPDWALDEASWEGGSSDAKGTSILIKPVRRQPIPKNVRVQLGYWFGPFLRPESGGQIIFHKGDQSFPLERWQLPPLEDDVIDTSVTVDGKRARIRAGVVPEGERNERAGITIAHIHRVIEEASGSCCGDYGYQRIAGVVMLDRGWGLTKNKDGFKDEIEAAALYAAVYDKIEPILQRGRQQHLFVESEAWTQALESEVNQRLFGFGRSAERDAKARRHPGSSQGTKTPTGTGGRHQRAAEEQPGATFPGRRRSSRTATRKTAGVKIQLGDFQLEDLRPGSFDPSGYVTLNSSHPCVKEDWDRRNADGLIRVVASIVANDEVWSRGSQAKFEYAEEGTPQERFLRRFGEMLANMRVLEGSG